MMRSPKSFVVAVRRADGQIVVREQKWDTLLKSVKPLRWPFLRGSIVLIESIWNGLSALNFSAEQAMPPEGSESKSSKTRSLPGSDANHDEVDHAVQPQQVTAKQKVALAFTLVISLALGLGLFVGAPHLLTWLLGVALGVGLDTDSVAFHAIDGVFKAAIFIGYLVGISKMPDIRRVFAYHGAEHKVIWSYENGDKLTAENAAKYSTQHPRCGTSFMLVVLLLSILFFSAVFPFIPKISEMGFFNQLAMIGIKLPLMLPLAGLSYELQKASARAKTSSWLRWLAKPGLLLQRITALEPSKDQLEIAVVALSRALAREQGSESPEGVRVFPNFESALSE